MFPAFTEPVQFAIGVAAASVVGLLYRRSMSLSALRAREQQYRLLFEESPQPMWFCDLQTGRILEVNNAASETYGYTRPEFLKLSVQEIALPGSVVHSDPGCVRVWQHRRKDGGLLTVDVSARVSAYAGRPAWFMTIRDITEQHRAQCHASELYRQLQERALELEALFHAAPVGLALSTDPDCDQIRANAHLERLLGLEPGYNLSPAHPGDRPAPFQFSHEGKPEQVSENAMLRAVRSKTAIGPEPVEVALAGGARLQLLVRAEPLLSPEGDVMGCVGSFTDLTGLQRVESALRVSQERFRRIFDEAPLGMLLIAADSMRIQNANSSLCTMLGYAPDELSQLTPGLLLSAEDRDLFNAISEGSIAPSQEEVRLLRKDGSSVSACFRAAPIRDEAGSITHVICMIEDVSARKELEEHLRQSQKMEAVGRLAGGVAHDFNNLLTVILGHASLAAESISDNEWLQGSVAEIQRSANRAAELTSQLLAFGRKQVLQPRLMDLNNVIAGAKEMVQRVAGDGIRLELSLDSNLGFTFADPSQLEQVIFNLAVNARDAMAGKGVLAIETANVERNGSLMVRLRMGDTGCGMDAETKSRIFEPFFTTKGLGYAPGLGLSSVYGVVQQSGGSIDVISEPGRGSAFEIYLPWEAPSKTESRDQGLRRRSGSVLLVEDEEGVRGLVAELLRRAGYAVFEAASGDDALQALLKSERRFDLLVTDVVMPRMSGPDLAARVAESHPAMGVLYISGYADHDAFQEGTVDLGASFLHKPFAPNLLLQKVDELLLRN